MHRILQIFLLVATARLECTEDLSEWQGPETIDLYISATDGFYTSGPEKMTVTIYNIWQPPTIDNLPNTVTKPETAPFGTIYTVSLVSTLCVDHIMTMT